MLDIVRAYGLSGRMRDGGGEDGTEEEPIAPTFRPGDELAVLVNDLGGTSNFEMSVLANSVVRRLESPPMGNCRMSRLYVGSYMTGWRTGRCVPPP